MIGRNRVKFDCQLVRGCFALVRFFFCSNLRVAADLLEVKESLDELISLAHQLYNQHEPEVVVPPGECQLCLILQVAEG